MAPHEKVFVDPEFLESDVHGDIGCHECHGGDPSAADWLEAHKGVERDPSFPDPARACGDCHPDIVEAGLTSLHTTLAPFSRVIDARLGGNNKAAPDVHDAREHHCSACHASCGQCHVSRPSYVEGGLLDGHRFQGTPPMREVCTACHGSRIEKEYLGKNESKPPDVHWRKRFFRCKACHTEDEMHAPAEGVENRFDAPHAPRCQDCHEEIYATGTDNQEQHLRHRDRVSCQVCHSVAYKTCYNCHFALDRYGQKYFKSGHTELDFKIGRNHRQSPRHPEAFVTLRHVPVDQHSFDFYASTPLKDFASTPTWKLATPHNIQRKTPQNISCNACHGNKALFLTDEDLRPEYRDANKSVVIPLDQIPPRINGQPQAPRSQ